MPQSKSKSRRPTRRRPRLKSSRSRNRRASTPSKRGRKRLSATKAIYRVPRKPRRRQRASGASRGGVNLSVARGEKLSTAQGAGLTALGRRRYNAATGSNLKPPAPYPKTEEDRRRKRSFCARMGGVARRAKNGTRARASLRRWNC